MRSASLPTGTGKRARQKRSSASASARSSVSSPSRKGAFSVAWKPYLRGAATARRQSSALTPASPGEASAASQHAPNRASAVSGGGT